MVPVRLQLEKGEEASEGGEGGDSPRWLADVVIARREELHHRVSEKRGNSAGFEGGYLLPLTFVSIG